MIGGEICEPGDIGGILFDRGRVDPDDLLVRVRCG